MFYLKALAALVGFYLLALILHLFLDGLDWLVMNIPYGTTIFGLTFVALFTWGGFKLMNIVLNKIEGK